MDFLCPRRRVRYSCIRRYARPSPQGVAHLSSPSHTLPWTLNLLLFLFYLPYRRARYSCIRGYARATSQGAAPVSGAPCRWGPRPDLYCRLLLPHAAHGGGWRYAHHLQVWGQGVCRWAWLVGRHPATRYKVTQPGKHFPTLPPSSFPQVQHLATYHNSHCCLMNSFSHFLLFLLFFLQVQHNDGIHAAGVP